LLQQLAAISEFLRDYKIFFQFCSGGFSARQYMATHLRGGTKKPANASQKDTSLSVAVTSPNANRKSKKKQQHPAVNLK